MYTLGIDLGATFIKAGLFDQSKNRLVASQRLPFPAFLNAGGLEREVVIQPIMDGVFKLVKELTQSIVEPVDLWISNQMQGFVLVDPSSSKAVSHFVTWQDQRSTQVWDQISKIYSKPILTQIGNELRVGHAATTLYAIHRTKPIPTGMMPISLGDFVVMCLTGRTGFIHDTNASGFGCFTINESNWNQPLLRNLGLDHLVWPEVIKEFRPLKTQSNFRVFGAVGDFQASLLGAGLENEKYLSLNVATGSQVSRIMSKISAETPGQIRPYFFGKNLSCQTHLPAGRALNFILRPFLNQEQKNMDQLFETLDRKGTAASDLKVNLQFFATGEESGGSIGNIREDNLNSESVLVAALNSMADTYCDSAGRIDPNRECNHVLASGGIITKSSYFRKLVERKLSRPVQSSTEQEDALWGLFRLSQLSNQNP